MVDCGHAKTGAEKYSSFEIFGLPLALAFALVCSGSDKIVDLIITTRINSGFDNTNANSRCYYQTHYFIISKTYQREFGMFRALNEVVNGDTCIWYVHLVTHT